MTEQDALDLGFEKGSQMQDGWQEYYIQRPGYENGVYISCNKNGEFMTWISPEYNEPAITIKDTTHLKLLIDFVFYPK